MTSCLIEMRGRRGEDRRQSVFPFRLDDKKSFPLARSLVAPAVLLLAGTCLIEPFEHIIEPRTRSLLDAIHRLETVAYVQISIACKTSASLAFLLMFDLMQNSLRCTFSGH